MMRVAIALVVSLLFGPLVGGAAVAAERVAFVVGNSDYANAPSLKNPVNDARLIATTLGQLGFAVFAHENLSREGVAREFAAFLQETKGADTTLFYFAGHGMQFERQNYLLGTDASLTSELDVDAEAVNLDRIVRMLERDSRAALVFVDACRDNPLANRLYAETMSPTRALATRGLAAMDGGYDGAMLTFSASPGEVAYDGGGANSPFAQALAKHLPTEGTEILSLMKRVIRDVRQATAGRQSPIVVNDLTVEIYLNLADEDAAEERLAFAREEALFKAAQALGTPAAWELYLERYPEGTFAGLAGERLSESAPSEPTLPPLDATTQSDPEEAASEDVQVASLVPAVAAVRRITPMRADDRRAVQAELNRKGLDAGPLDGVFGRRTRAAIAKLQERLKLPTTGLVLTATADALALDLTSMEGKPASYATRRARRYVPAELARHENDPRLLRVAKVLRDQRYTYGFFNGHMYVAVMPPRGNILGSQGLGVFGAQRLAEELGGYVASITSAAENAFVFNLVRHEPDFWFAHRDMDGWKTDGPFFGLHREFDNGAARGSWRWMSGEPVRYANWSRSPSRDEGNAKYMVRFFHNNSDGAAPIPGARWRDAYGAFGAFILEIE